MKKKGNEESENQVTRVFTVTFTSDGYLDAESLHECLSENLDLREGDELVVTQEETSNETDF